jgi:HSP20 family protein
MFALTPWRTRRLARLPRVESPLDWMGEEFPGLINRLFTRWPLMEALGPFYPWDVMTEEKEKEFIVRVELPGFEPSEVKVELLAERLMIEAEHKEPAEKAEEKPERAFAHLKRMILLPPGLELEKAEAVYRNGVLEVRVPRTPEAVGRRIEVKT